jgi:hypothetical protein
MADSNMFIMYTDGSGNVTLSPRLGANHVMPSEESAADLTLLAGSGVDGSTMRANVLCTNCNSWSSGEMSLSSTSSGWIAAWKSGSSLDTTDKDATIQQHDSTSQWNLNLQNAVVSSDSNPFESSSSSSGSSSGSGSDDSGSSSGGSTSSGSDSSGISTTGGSSQTPQLISAHGIIMAITFVIMYPIGSILMPLLGRWAIHATWYATLRETPLIPIYSPIFEKCFFVSIDYTSRRL